jgi:hypothetical protein
LVVANPAVLFLGALNRWPRLARVFPAVSLVVAVAVIVAEALEPLHR